MSRPDLALLALRYAAGELVGPEAVAFEARLATDGAARDVLGEAVRLSAAVSGVPVPVPQAGTLAALRDRLFPTPLSRLFPVKSYRGHPIVWISLGGLVAGLLTFANDPVTRRVELPRSVPAVEVPAVSTPSTETVPSASPVARMGSTLPTPMPQPHADAPAELPAETKKG